ncbi:MAG: thiamine diphosphokinase [Saccharofermentans sp.]|nr:thiamine diphosphokinase [Saccharofermentans sp.]
MPHAAEVLSSYASKANSIICADSGVDYAREAGIKIDKVFGDLDSISEVGKAYVDINRIPLEVFPCEKDMTDTELVLSSTSGDVVLFVALNGRIDHIMGNILMCARYVDEGRKIMITDGSFKVYFLKGEDTLYYETCGNEVVSLLPLRYDEDVTGVTTRGLYYELSDATLKYGYSLGVSNCFKKSGTSCEISQKSGIMGVFIGPES